MKKSVLKLTIGIAVFAATSAITQAQTAATTAAPAAPSCPFEDLVQQAKNPTDWLTWGADVRLRNEYVNNALTLSEAGARHEQDYFRFRERLWASVMPVTNLSVNARFAAEEREWMKPSNAGQYGYRSGFEERYGILDNAYVKWNNIADQPLTLSAGRQDIALGDPDDWWLVLDGTPGDGSWTYFLDSIRTCL